MKFKTPSSDDGVEVWKAFQQACARHLDEMRGVLPDHVLELATLQGVDDGLIVEVRHDKIERVLHLTLRCGDLQMGYYDLILTYKDADISPKHEKLLAKFARTTIDPGHYDAEICRFEVDLTEDGRIEHRIEFYVEGPDDWIAIRCRSLYWEKVSRPNRELPVLLDRFPGGPISE